MTYFAPLVKQAAADWVSVEVPVSRRWLAAVRFCIPSKHKRQEGGVWLFHRAIAGVVLDITRTYFPQAQVQGNVEEYVEREAAALNRWERLQRGEVFGTGQKGDSLSARDVLCVTKDAPPEVVKAAYRALVGIHHPDRGGDPERFRAVQEAWEELEEVI